MKPLNNIIGCCAAILFLLCARPGGSQTTAPQAQMRPSASAPRVSVSPSHATVGNVVFLSGAGFTANNTATLYIQPPSGSPALYTLTANTDGNGSYFNRSWNAPGNDATTGTHKYWAKDNATGTLSDTVSFVYDPIPLTTNNLQAKNKVDAIQDGYFEKFEIWWRLPILGPAAWGLVTTYVYQRDSQGAERLVAQANGILPENPGEVVDYKVTITATAQKDVYDYRLVFQPEHPNVLPYRVEYGQRSDLTDVPMWEGATFAIADVGAHPGADADGDGYYESLQLNWQVTVAGSSEQIYGKLYRRNASGVENLVLTTSPYTVVVGSVNDFWADSFTTSEQGIFDFRLEIYRVSDNVLLTSLAYNVDPDWVAIRLEPGNINTTITSDPAGRTVIVDGSSYTTPRTFSWQLGSQHTLSVSSPQAGGTGTQYSFSSWSDGGSQAHTITVPAQASTITANFRTEYLLTRSNNPSNGGSITVNPSGTYFNNGTPVTLTAVPAGNYVFSSWSGDASGSTNPVTITMNSPKSVVANYVFPAAPVVSAIHPNTAQPGQNLLVTITGANFVNGATVALNGTGITINSASVTSATQIAADLSIAASAPTGLRDVTVTNPDGKSGTGAGLFTVRTGCPITWQVNLTVRDIGTGSGILTFGQGPNATDNIDVACGEAELPPPPPSGIFDTRFELPGSPIKSSLKDYRNDSEQAIAWRMKFQPGTTGAMTFSWNIADFPAGSFFLKDEITGTLVNVDMKTQSSYTLTNTAITSLKIDRTTDVVRNVVVAAGWNIISVPVRTANMAVISLFSDAVSSAFAYSNGYAAATTLNNGSGYWLKFNAARTYAISGATASPKTIFVNAGWNIIGPFDTDVPVSAITSTPSGIIASSYFGYSNGYVSSTTLSVGKGYWVKASQAGTLQIPGAAGNAKNSAEAENFVADDSWPRLVITDSEGRSRALYLAAPNEINGQCELPPIPPSGIFDVRFSSDRFVESIASVKHDILINVGRYPLRMQAHNLQGRSFILKDGINGTLLNEKLQEGKELVITAALERLVLASDERSASRYELGQNAPNPYNPSTTITFTLPEKTHVKILVYNTLGVVVAELVNQELPPGEHRVEFRAQNFASGVYFYAMEAGSFRELKKMLVVK